MARIETMSLGMIESVVLVPREGAFRDNIKIAGPLCLGYHSSSMVQIGSVVEEDGHADRQADMTDSPCVFISLYTNMKRCIKLMLRKY